MHYREDVQITYHQGHDSDNSDNDGVPVVGKELHEGGDALVGQQNCTQRRQRSRRVNLSVNNLDRVTMQKSGEGNKRRCPKH